MLDAIEGQAVVIDRHGRILETNSAWLDFAELAGVAEAASPGESLPEFCRTAHVYGGGGPAAIARSALAVATGQSPGFDAEYPSFVGGEPRNLCVRIRPVTAGDGAALVQQIDRTEAHALKRQTIEETHKATTLASALETSHRALELAVRGGNLGLWHWDVKSGYFELSGDWLETLGHERACLNADVVTFRELLPPDERVLWTAEDAASLAPEEPYDRQFRLRRRDGSYAWVQALGRSNAELSDGTPESLSGILIDIDDRKHSELHDAGMAKIIEDSLNEVYVIDRETHHFIVVNRGARENLGYSLSALREMTPLDINPEYDEESYLRVVSGLDTEENQRLEFETLHRREDGGSYPVMISLQRSELVGRQVYVAIGVDLTQRHELESRLSQARKLESIGQLAAGVAHEMNTPLQYVGANIKYLSDCSDHLFEVVDALGRSLELDAPDRPPCEHRHAAAEAIRRTNFARIRSEMPKAIADSIEGVERLLHIVRAMKEFSHPGEQKKSPTDLNRAITSTTVVTRSRWKHAAELVLDLDASLPHVECEPGAINQVFVNLIVNAADAIGERAASEPGCGKGQITARTFASDDEVTIEIEDNGCGMPAEVQRRAFDPFFTTKEVGRGTGQGLSLSHTIVAQNHGGALQAISTPGEGTIMRVVLPICSQSAAQDKTRKKSRV